MAALSGVGFPCGSKVRVAVLWVCVLGLVVGAGLQGGRLVAQDAPITTLHVYANSIQVPVLVLGRNHEAIPQIAGNRFNVSIDDGPLFRATHVRLEGDDPISLSILLDVGGSETEMLAKIGEAIAGLAPLSLHARDQVSVYVLDCSLVRSLKDEPAEYGRLKAGVDSALQPWVSRGRKARKRECQHPMHLWDALTYMTSEMTGLSGRRVILAVTDGNDTGSKRTWNELRTYAQSTGVAIFGLSFAPAMLLRQGVLNKSYAGHEDALEAVCELSGGMVIGADERGVAQKLKLFTTMVRGRYIVEFPRPLKGEAGQHHLDITIKKSDASIRAAGISVPVPDPVLMADPMTVPTDPSSTPELGKHHVKNTPQ